MTLLRCPRPHSLSRPRWGMLLALWAGLLLISTPGHAQDKPNREREQLRRMQQSLSQAQAAQSAAEAEKAALADKLAKAEAELAALNDPKTGVKHQLQMAQAELAAARRDEAAAKERTATYEKAVEDLREKAKTTIAEVVKTANDRITQTHDENTVLRDNFSKVQGYSRQLEERIQSLTPELSNRTAALKSCEAKNQELVNLNEEMRQRYADKGIFDIFRRAEPLTGIGAVREENALQAVEDRAEAARVPPSVP